MSPWPSSTSAPFWSSTMRLSMRAATRKPMRQGMLDLIRPVTTFACGRCVARIDVDADRAALLGQADDVGLDLLAGGHHQVGQLVDDDHDVRQVLGDLGLFLRRARVEPLDDLLRAPSLLYSAMFLTPASASSSYRSSIFAVAHSRICSAVCISVTIGHIRCGMVSNAAISTIFGSTRISLTSSGRWVIRMPT